MRPLDPSLVEAALSDPHDRRILSACVDRARPVRELEAETGLPHATVYRHVNRLSEVGLLVVERSAMTPDGKPYDLYRSRVTSGRIEMDGSGVRTTWKTSAAVDERLERLWWGLRER